jgi:CHAD domain-containing protein
MREVVREVEVKFSVDEDYEVSSLFEPGAATYRGTPVTPGEPERQVLRATYFDTANLDLARHRLTLRRRLGGRDSGWHLKVPQGGTERSEVRLPLGRAPVSRVPEPLQRLVRARALDQPLVPIAKITTHRTVYRLFDATGHAVLELADDRVSARRVLSGDGSGQATGPEVAWREIELEVLDGDRDTLAALTHELQRRGMEVATHASKIARVLELEMHAPDATGRRPESKRPTLKTPMSRVSMSYVLEQVEQIRAQDILVRIDAPASVHTMRVATRRLRSALATYGRTFAPDAVGPLRAELGWLAGILGAVRDAEVMRERVLGALQAESENASATSGELEASASLNASYAQVRGALLHDLDGERFGCLLQMLEAFVQKPPTTADGGRPAGKTLRRAVAREYADVRRLVKRARAAGQDSGREEHLHDARKAAKRARYAAELASFVYGRRARDFAAAMETVQELLGQHQDAVVLRQRLFELSGATTDPISAFTYGRLHAMEEARARQAEDRLPSVWAAASRKELRRWLR